MLVLLSSLFVPVICLPFAFVFFVPLLECRGFCFWSEHPVRRRSALCLLPVRKRGMEILLHCYLVTFLKKWRHHKMTCNQCIGRNEDKYQSMDTLFFFIFFLYLSDLSLILQHWFFPLNCCSLTVGDPDFCEQIFLFEEVISVYLHVPIMIQWVTTVLHTYLPPWF